MGLVLGAWLGRSGRGAASRGKWGAAQHMAVTVCDVAWQRRSCCVLVDPYAFHGPLSDVPSSFLHPCLLQVLHTRGFVVCCSSLVRWVGAGARLHGFVW